MYCKQSTAIFDRLIEKKSQIFSPMEFSPWDGEESPYEKHTTRVICPPPVFSSEAYEQISDAAMRATSIISGILDTVFDGNVEKMLEWQGHPAHVRKFVSQVSNRRGLVLGRYFSRPDILIGENGPCIVEVNFGQSNGSHAFMDTIYRKFLGSSYCRELAAEGIQFPEPQSMRRWGRAVNRQMRCQMTAHAQKHFYVAMATEDEVIGAKDYIQDFVREIGHLGYRVTLGLLNDLDATGETANYNNDPVHVVYCMCTYAEMQRADVSERLISDLVRLDQMKTLDFFGSPANLVFDCKANLALLHDPTFSRHFSEDDLEWVNRHIPKTMLAENLTEDHRFTWVHKPINDFGGHGVSVVKGENLRDKYVCAEHIIQKVVQNTCIWPKNTSSHPAHEYCFGPSVIDGEVVAMNLRSQLSNDEVPIINSAQGAAVGAVISSI